MYKKNGLLKNPNKNSIPYFEKYWNVQLRKMTSKRMGKILSKHPSVEALNVLFDQYPRYVDWKFVLQNPVIFSGNADSKEVYKILYDL